MGLFDMILKAVDADYAESRTASYELGYRAREGLQQERNYGAKRMVDERHHHGHDNRGWLRDGPRGDEPEAGGWFW